MRFTYSALQLSWVVELECKGVIRPSERAGYNYLSLLIFVGWLVGVFLFGDS